VDRYRAFWDRDDTGRPLIGFSLKSWFPLEEYAASAAWKSRDYLTPDMVRPESFMEDQVRLLREGEEIEDDIFRGASPSQAVPWLNGMLGSRIRILPGSTLAEERILPWEELRNLQLDPDQPWYRKYMEFAETLVRIADGRFPVSHGTLHGPTDIVAMLRGHSQSIIDLSEEPEKSGELLERMFLLDAFLEIEEIGCYEVNNDVSGPPVKEMLHYFRMIQHADRSLLIRGSFSTEELRLLMEGLDAKGLYLYIMIESAEEIPPLRSVLGV